MPHGLQIDDVAKFQNVLNQALQGAVFGANSDAIHTALKAAAQDVMPDVPAAVKLSELMEMARKGFHKNPQESFFALYEESQYGGGHLFLDDDPKPGLGYGADDGKYSAKHCIAFQKDGSVYSLKLRGAHVTPASRPNALSRFDGVLLAMYVGRTRLEVDIDAYDVESAAREQDPC